MHVPRLCILRWSRRLMWWFLCGWHLCGSHCKRFRRSVDGKQCPTCQEKYMCNSVLVCCIRDLQICHGHIGFNMFQSVHHQTFVGEQHALPFRCATGKAPCVLHGAASMNSWIRWMDCFWAGRNSYGLIFWSCRQSEIGNDIHLGWTRSNFWLRTCYFGCRWFARVFYKFEFDEIARCYQSCPSVWRATMRIFPRLTYQLHV